MTFPRLQSYATANLLTSLALPPVGHLFREPRVNLGPSAGSWQYKFFLTGTTTPVDVYQDANFLTPFAPQGVVTADAFGRFPAIYLNNSVTYRVRLFNSSAVLQRTTDPYYPPMAATGSAATGLPVGLTVNGYNEVILNEASAGGTGIELTLNAPANGGPALKLQGNAPSAPMLTMDVTVTTGAQNATFSSINKPPTNLINTGTPIAVTVAPAGGAYVGGTLTANWGGPTGTLFAVILSTGQVITGCTLTNGSTVFTTPSTVISGTPTVNINVAPTPAGWLPVRCDGQPYYTPIWRNDPFTPYVFSGSSYQGQTISGNNANVGAGVWVGGGPVTLNSDGTTAIYGAGSTITPPNYFSPPQPGIGTNTWINITTTSNPSTNNFSAAVGAWTNIGAGLSVSLTSLGSGAVGVCQGTYQLSSSVTGTPVTANGTIALAPTLSLYGANGLTGANGGTGTETIPSGPYTTIIIEVWPGGGGGGGCSPNFANGGGGGASGSYSRSSYSISALGGAGKTFNVTWGNGGLAGAVNVSGGNGAASSVTAGTVAGFTTMTTNGGGGGAHGTNGSPGAGGTAGGAGTGGTLANLAGIAGGNGSGFSGGSGAHENPTVIENPSGFFFNQLGQGGFGGFSGGGNAGYIGGVLFTYI